MSPKRVGTSKARLMLHRGIVLVARTLLHLVPTRSILEGPRGSKILMQAGERGWELIEYEELRQSAVEYFGEAQVITSVVTPGPGHIRRMRLEIQSANPQFVFLDPRSRDVSVVRRIVESLITAMLLKRYDVTPIVWLTDAAVRAWRMQSEILSAEQGAIYVFLHPIEDDIAFAHSRVYGPTPFPISEARIESLEQAYNNSCGRQDFRSQALFIGSMYEPRATILRQTQAALLEIGHDLVLRTRESTAPRMPNEDYWRNLTFYAVVFTTGAQTWTRGMDRTSAEQLTFRYFEATAARCALVARTPTGSEGLLQPGREYLAIERYEDAAAAIAGLLEDPNLLNAMAMRGFSATKRLAVDRAFWSAVDGVR